MHKLVPAIKLGRDTVDLRPLGLGHINGEPDRWAHDCKTKQARKARSTKNVLWEFGGWVGRRICTGNEEGLKAKM